MGTWTQIVKCCVILAFVCVCGKGAPGGDVVVVQSDTNKDGKPDRWFFKVDDRVTTALIDRDFDGKVDQCSVFETVGGKQKAVKIWFDMNGDGKYDALTVQASEDVTETWRELIGKEPTFRYVKRDRMAKVLTIGTVSALGVRAGDGCTTAPMAQAGSGPVRVGVENGEAYFSPEGKMLRTKLALPDGIFVEEERFSDSGIPGKTTILDKKNSLRVILERDDLGRIGLIGWYKPGTEEQMQALDRNRDGRYDQFIHWLKGVIVREELDEDYDGLLDKVSELGKSGTTVLTGNQIPNRALPDVPALASISR